MSEKIPNFEKNVPSPEKDQNELRRTLDHAIQYETTEKLLSLFENGMDVDQEDFEGRTALQMMSFKGKKDAVEKLISMGADVNYVFMFQNRIPMTALDAAREARKTEIVDILIAHGAKTGKELKGQ